MRDPIRITRRTAAAWMLASSGAHARGLNADVCPPQLQLAATTTDLASLAATIGGDQLQVHSMLPPLADPESFEPGVRELALLSRAALLVRVGLGFDAWLEKLLGRTERELAKGGPSIVDVSAGIPLLEVHGRDPFARDSHSHALANPHYWLDPGNAEAMTASIAAAIAQACPSAAQAVLENRERFLRQLRQRMAEWSRQLAPHRGAAVVTYHNSWPYFARRFHLNVVGFIEPREGVTPSAGHLANLLSLARRSGVRAVLQATNEPRRLSRIVAERLGVPLVQLAPAVASAPRINDYLSFMQYNVSALASAFDSAR